LSDENGISPLVILPIMLAVFAGCVVYVAFARVSAPSADFQVLSIDIISAGNAGLATATVQNTGMVVLENVRITIRDDSGAGTVLSIGDLAPGQTKGAENWEGRWTPGSTYIAKITAVVPGEGEMVRAITAVAHG
jgi:hypothetical protein